MAIQGPAVEGGSAPAERKTWGISGKIFCFPELGNCINRLGTNVPLGSKFQTLESERLIDAMTAAFSDNRTIDSLGYWGGNILSNSTNSEAMQPSWGLAGWRFRS